MKASLSYKSKRNIVICAIIVVLAAAIGTGTYFFTKGNSDQTEAFLDNGMQIGETSQTETQGNEGDATANPEENQGEVIEPNLEQNQDGSSEENGDETTSSSTGTTTGNNGSTTNNGTTGSTTGNVPNEDYVTERVEEQEVLVSEDYEVAWSPLTIEATTSTAELEIIRPIILAEKLTNKSTVVPGDEIEYTIVVKNSGKIAGKTLVKDIVPMDDIETDIQESVNTTFKEGSIKINGEPATKVIEATETESEQEVPLTEQDLIDGIEIEVPACTEIETENGTETVAGETTVSFTVIVDMLEKVENEEETSKEIKVKGTVKNIAVVNDEDTNPVYNPIITYKKQVDNAVVKYNEQLKYTIIVTNTGGVAGTAIVSDETPEETVFVEGSIKINGELATKVIEATETELEQEVPLTAQDLKKGIEVEIPANGEVEVSFIATAKDLEDGYIIRNQAKVNDKPTNETETVYQEPIINAVKATNKETVVPGDEIEYTITVSNTGSASGKTIVKDSAPTEPVKTTFKAESIKINGKAETTLTEQDLINGIEVDVPARTEKGAGETTVSFTVTIDEPAKGETVEGTVENIAVVNGKDTNPVYNPIIKYWKEVDKTEAKINDTLIYTIVVQNTGNIDSKAIVSDEAPRGTTFEAGSIKIDEKEETSLTERDLKDGIEVDVPENGKVEVSFEVKISEEIKVSDLNSNNKIENTAKVNNKDTDKVETAVLTSYTEIHIYDGVPEDPIPMGDFEIGEVIDFYKLKEKGDYKFVKVEGLDLTLDADASKNVVKIYYETPKFTATKDTNISAGTKLQKGETAKFTITVKNTGNVTGDAIVTDTIPDGLIYSSYNNKSAGKNDTIIEPKGDSKTLTWNVIGLEKGKERTIEIVVEVDEVKEAKTITNEVKVNDKKTDDASVNVIPTTIEASKNGVVELKRDDNGRVIPGQNEKQAEVGDTIIYTITAKNTSEAGTTPITIKDSVPKNTTFKAQSITIKGVEKIKVNNKEIDVTTKTLKALTEQDLENGITAIVPAGKTITLKFKVTVNDNVPVATKIKNTATVNEEKVKSDNITVVKKICINATAETINALDMVLVLDVSGSMKGDDLTDLKNAAKSLANNLFCIETDSTITLIKYSTSATNLGTYKYADYNTEGNLLDKIDGLEAKSSTNIYKALVEVNNTLDNMDSTNRNRLVIFLTDGTPTFYYKDETEKELIGTTNHTDSTNYENNLRPQIIEQAEILKSKKNTEVYSIGVGITDLSNSKIQYVEEKNSSNASVFNKTTEDNKYYYMWEREYGKYILNNIATSGKYIETKNIKSTFDKIFKDQVSSKHIYTATKAPVVLEIPVTGNIVDDKENSIGVTVQIGTGTPTTYYLKDLKKNGKDGLRYEETNKFKGFIWTIEANDPKLNQELYISYTIRGAAQ